MAPTPFPLLTLLFVSAAFAGCAGAPSEPSLASEAPIGDEGSPAHDRVSRPPMAQEEPPATPGTDQPPAGESEAPPPETRLERVYGFSGFVVGASPPHPAGYGPLVDGQPVAKQDTFEAPAGTVRLEIAVHGDWQDVGSSRVHITGPDGELVYATTRYGDGLGGFCVRCGHFHANATGPGTYTVSYYVVGAFDLTVRVDACVVVPGTPQSGTGGAPPPV